MMTFIKYLIIAAFSCCVFSCNEKNDTESVTYVVVAGQRTALKESTSVEDLRRQVLALVKKDWLASEETEGSWFDVESVYLGDGGDAKQFLDLKIEDYKEVNFDQSTLSSLL